MFRDTRRYKAYFEDLLQQFDEGIQEIDQSLATGEIVLPDEQVDAAQQLYQLAILRAVAHYSYGASRERLAPMVADILPLRRRLKAVADTLPASQQVYRNPFEVFGGQGKAAGSPNINRYIYALWWLSLVVACGLDEGHRHEVLALIDNEGRDRLLDRIAVTMGERDRVVGDQMLYPELYQPLLDAFAADAVTRPQLIEQFLNNWYEQCQDADWYDNHLCELEFVYTDYYVGYWSLEAVLVVNLLNINDSGFREHPYYPRDLRA